MDQLRSWDVLGRLTWDHIVIVLVVLAGARLLTVTIRRAFRHLAERAAPRYRLTILRSGSVLRLAIGLSAILSIIPIVVEPTPRNVLVLLAGIGVAIAFALKEYASSLAAGVVAVLENTYQPGDWVEMGGAYGEVKAVSLRAVRLVTVDDTEIIAPHSWLWSHSVKNATSGSRSLLCVTRFFLHPDHDASAVCQALESLSATSRYRQADSATTIVVTEHPWGTEYKLKAYVSEGREQFAFTTDLTVRGKAALRTLGIRFAWTPVAMTGSD